MAILAKDVAMLGRTLLDVKSLSQLKRVYLKTSSKQVGGWSTPFQNFFDELIFDIRWGQIPFQ